MIPMFLTLVVVQPKEEGGRNLRLWLPLFLVWILLLPIILIAVLVWGLLRLAALGSDVALRGALAMEAAVKVFWYLDGLRVDIRGRDSRFILHF